MLFHDYTTLKPPGFRGSTEHYISSFMRAPHDGSKQSSAKTVRGALEAGWLRRERPFYNVYPIAIELCATTSLNMKWGDIAFPTRYILLRFPAGHEPLGLRTALLRVPSNGKEETRVEAHASRLADIAEVKSLQLMGSIDSGGVQYGWGYKAKGDLRDQVVGESLDIEYPDDFMLGSSGGVAARHVDQAGFLIRLLAFIGLLARGTDLITPAILSKDRDEYDAASDESRKRWLEDRAARRLGRGFDIGRSLEIERAASPHWRSPHLALFHTGPGRSVPVLKLRSGCVVIPKDMSQVPTGYLGEEKPDERRTEQKSFFRTPIPWRLRFRVMQRDNRRCRVCGLTADDGVRMEVDHIVPVAKGGKTVESNLWVLCQPCNGGKSDSDLTMALESK